MVTQGKDSTVFINKCPLFGGYIVLFNQGSVAFIYSVVFIRMWSLTQG